MTKRVMLIQYLGSNHLRHVDEEAVPDYQPYHVPCGVELPTQPNQISDLGEIMNGCFKPLKLRGGWLTSSEYKQNKASA